MVNYLFYNNDTGEYFFIQLERWCPVEDAWEIVEENFPEDDIEYIDCYTDEEAERMGYDTY